MYTVQLVEVDAKTYLITVDVYPLSNRIPMRPYPRKTIVFCLISGIIVAANISVPDDATPKAGMSVIVACVLITSLLFFTIDSARLWLNHSG